MQYLIVILDEAANSFCYYPNPNRKSKLMDLKILKEVIYFAQINNLLINFLVGKKPLPKEYIEAIDVINHILITPPEYPQDNVDDVLVLDYTKGKIKTEIPDNQDKNVILKIDKSQLKRLAAITSSLSEKYLRINISIENIDTFSSEDFAIYKEQLKLLSAFYLLQNSRNKQIEINLISDRFFLQKMNNCEAGIKHITVASNGKFYICPAFYYEDETDFVGDLKNGICIKNKQLLQLSHAPLCRKCDAFQCKRCVWLNRKSTLEVNTPSHQQCVVSHLERNEAKDLLQRLRNNNIDFWANEIPEIDYLDPIDKEIIL